MLFLIRWQMLSRHIDVFKTFVNNIEIPTNVRALKQSKDKQVLLYIKNDVRLNVDNIILPGLVDKISASYSNTRVLRWTMVNSVITNKE